MALTVEQFFPLSQAALAGQATSLDFADIDNLTANINDAFDGRPRPTRSRKSISLLPARQWGCRSRPRYCSPRGPPGCCHL